jgi:hypothetical protein
MSLLLKIINKTLRYGIFAIAFLLVILFIVSVDEFVVKQRLYFFRTGNFEDLIVISAFAILVGFVLKRLLVLQWRWGVKK